jgi:hypothetical protein
MGSSYLDTSLQTLERQMEYSSDALAVQLVRVQQLSQSISLTFALRTNDGPSEMPVNMFIKTFQQQLDSFKATVPEHLRQHRAYPRDPCPAASPLLLTLFSGAISSHMRAAEILLYEVAIQENQPGLFMSPQDRLEMLWSCVLATKASLSQLFCSPKPPNAPMQLCIQAFDGMYAFLVALKLMTLKTPGWDPRLVRKELDFDRMFDSQIAVMFDVAERRRAKTAAAGRAATGAHRPRIDAFERLGTKLLRLKACILAELDSLQAPDLAEEQPATAGLDVTQDLLQSLDSWPDLFAASSWDTSIHSSPFGDYWSTAT